MKKPGIGLIGCGTWGSVHARTYAASPFVQLIAISDQDVDRAATAARNCGAEKHSADWRELLADAEINAVAIATPDFAHGEIVQAAIDAGKDILVEKPLATTIEECERILDARRAKGVKLMVDFHNRWNLPFVNIRRMLQSGEMGDLLAINIRLNDTLFVPTKMLGWASCSSPAHFLGSHVVDIIRWLSGAEVTRVYSVSRSLVLKNAGIDTPDFFQSILELSSGATAVVENCWVVNESSPSVFDFQCEFIGSAASAYVNASHHAMLKTYTTGGVAYPDVACAADLHGKPVGFGVAAIEHFIDCLTSGREPMVTGEDGLAAARVVAAMVKSAGTGQPVELRQ